MDTMQLFYFTLGLFIGGASVCALLLAALLFGRDKKDQAAAIRAAAIVNRHYKKRG